MNVTRRSPRFLPLLALLLGAPGCAGGPRPAARDPLVAQLSELAAASLSDAVDQVTGKRGFRKC